VTASQRVLVADDEAPARERVMALLGEEGRYRRIAETDSGPATLRALLTDPPDLLFLDVQMPGMNGLEVMARVPPQGRPVTIFTTAFEQYALDAFEASAVDYLLKPYTDERFLDALGRAELLLRGRQLEDWRRRVSSLVLGVAGPEEADAEENLPLERFAVRQGDRLTLVDVRDVDWIEASGDYLELHTGKARHLVRMTMQEVEGRLDAGFARVHRSAIVRLDRVAALEPYGAGEETLILRDGTRLRVSRRYRNDLRRRLGLG